MRSVLVSCFFSLASWGKAAMQGSYGSMAGSYGTNSALGRPALGSPVVNYAQHGFVTKAGRYGAGSGGYGASDIMSSKSGGADTTSGSPGGGGGFTRVTEGIASLATAFGPLFGGGQAQAASVPPAYPSAPAAPAPAGTPTWVWVAIGGDGIAVLGGVAYAAMR